MKPLMRWVHHMGGSKGVRGRGGSEISAPSYALQKSSEIGRHLPEFSAKV